MQEYAPKNFVVLQFTNQEYESLSHEMCDLKVKGVLTEMAQLKFFLHMLLHRLLELLFFDKRFSGCIYTGCIYIGEDCVFSRLRS